LDFYVSLYEGGRLRLVPYSFKYDPETLTLRQKDLMAITREFCRLHGEELQLIDQQFFDEPFILNYDSVRAYYDISNFDFYKTTNVAGITHAIANEVMNGSGVTLLHTCRVLAGEFGTTPTVVHQVAMHCVAQGVLRVDLSSPVGLERMPMSAYSTAFTPRSGTA